MNNCPGDICAQGPGMRAHLIGERPAIYQVRVGILFHILYIDPYFSQLPLIRQDQARCHGQAKIEDVGDDIDPISAGMRSERGNGQFSSASW